MLDGDWSSDVCSSDLDVMPFVVNRLSADARKHVSGIVMISPSRTASFEFHVSEWIGGSSEEGYLPVLPELEKLKGENVLCMAGSEESDSLCRELKLPWVRNVILPGGHHLGGDYAKITRTILDHSEAASR
jgi:type IV secretory pathway VirJ component